GHRTSMASSIGVAEAAPGFGEPLAEILARVVERAADLRGRPTQRAGDLRVVEPVLLDPPHRQLDPRRLQRLAPGEDGLARAVAQRPVQVEQKDRRANAAGRPSTTAGARACRSTSPASSTSRNGNLGRPPEPFLLWLWTTMGNHGRARQANDSGI